MKNYESKYNNASLKMINGLIEALKYKNFMDISVKELCLLSGVNRTTFYSHYSNMLELLEDTKNYMVNTFLASYKDTSAEQIKKGEIDKDFISEEYLIPYLKFVKQNRWLYSVYTKHHLSMGGENSFNDIVQNIAKPVSRTKTTIVDEVALVYTTRFFIEAINAVVKEWIKRNFKESEEYICKIILEASTKGKNKKV